MYDIVDFYKRNKPQPIQQQEVQPVQPVQQQVDTLTPSVYFGSEYQNSPVSDRLVKFNSWMDNHADRYLTPEQKRDFIASSKLKKDNPFKLSDSDFAWYEGGRDSSGVGGVAELGLSLGQGALGGVKSISHFVGEGNAVSQFLDKSSENLEGFKTGYTKSRTKFHNDQIKKAEDSGDLQAEANAYIAKLYDQSGDTLAQGVGSFAPNLLLGLFTGGTATAASLGLSAAKYAKLAPYLVKAVNAAPQAALGAVQGIGAIKGSQADITRQEALRLGFSEAEADEMAAKAAEYSADNIGQQALGGVLGLVGGATGPIEKGIQKLFAKKAVDSVAAKVTDAAAKGLIRKTAEGFATEAITEGAQGSQERYAGNLGAISQGVLESSKSTKGVFGTGLSEGVVGGVLGGGMGAANLGNATPQSELDPTVNTSTKPPVDPVKAQPKGKTKQELADAIVNATDEDAKDSAFVMAEDTGLFTQQELDGLAKGKPISRVYGEWVSTDTQEEANARLVNEAAESGKSIDELAKAHAESYAEKTGNPKVINKFAKRTVSAINGNPEFIRYTEQQALDAGLSDSQARLVAGDRQGLNEENYDAQSTKLREQLDEVYKPSKAKESKVVDAATTEIGAQGEIKQPTKVTAESPLKFQDAVGQVVDYQGITGRLQLIDGDYYVTSKEAEPVIIKSGLSGVSPANLGVTYPTPKAVRTFEYKETGFTDGADIVEDTNTTEIIEAVDMLNADEKALAVLLATMPSQYQIEGLSQQDADDVWSAAVELAAQTIQDQNSLPIDIRSPAWKIVDTIFNGEGMEHIQAAVDGRLQEHLNEKLADTSVAETTEARPANESIEDTTGDKPAEQAASVGSVIEKNKLDAERDALIVEMESVLGADGANSLIDAVLGDMAAGANFKTMLDAIKTEFTSRKEKDGQVQPALPAATPQSKADDGVGNGQLGQPKQRDSGRATGDTATTATSNAVSDDTSSIRAKPAGKRTLNANPPIADNAAVPVDNRSNLSEFVVQVKSRIDEAFDKFKNSNVISDAGRFERYADKLKVSVSDFKPKTESERSQKDELFSYIGEKVKEFRRQDKDLTNVQPNAGGDAVVAGGAEAVLDKKESKLADYLNRLSKLNAGRIKTILGKQFRTKDGIKTRAEIIEGFVNDGATVKERTYSIPLTQKTRAEVKTKYDLLFREITNERNAEKKAELTSERVKLGEQLSSGMRPSKEKELVYPNGDRVNNVLAEELKYAEHLSSAPSAAAVQPKAEADLAGKLDDLSQKEEAAKAKMLNALGKLAALASKNTRMNWTPEEEQKLLPIVIELFDGAMELGAVTFQKAVRYVRDYISKGIDQETADAIPFETLQGAYIATSGRHKDKGVTPKKEVASFDSLDELEAEEKVSLTDTFYDAIKSGNMPKDNPALRKMVETFDGKPADNARLKEAQEELEAAIARTTRDVIAEGKGQQDTFDKLLRLYNSQPLLNIRTSTSIANQAYSTPAPLAYLASELAGITQADTVLEPTGGTGMLIAGANPSKTLANELNDHRAELLRAQGFTVTQDDATNGFKGAFDKVNTNPPFGSIKDDKGNVIKVPVDGYRLGQIDHLIAARALAAMKDNGKATLILGANKVAGGISNDDLIFFNWLYAHYNVTGHFEVNGDLYARQGAGWPVRVISISGRQKSNKTSPIAGTVKRADNWNQVYEYFNNSLDSSRTGTNPSTTSSAGSSSTGKTSAGSVRGDAGQKPARPDQQRPAGSAGGDGNVSGIRAGAVSDSTKPATEPVGERADAKRLDDAPSSGDRLDAAGVNPEGRTGQPSGTAGATSLSSGGNQFQAKYVPRSSRKDEGVLIPVNMQAPTQDALSKLEDAVGNIDEYAAKELGYANTKELHDALMGLQVDSVASAIYQIKQGKGVVIADQTGIGKGRQAAAIIRWAAKQGHTPVFVTVKSSLFTDMYGDLADIGTNDIKPFIMNVDEWIAGENSDKLFRNKKISHKNTLQTIAATGELPTGSNALFMTYSQINVDNIQRKALNALADKAVFILDESHNAGGDSATGNFIVSALDVAKGVTYLSATYAKRPDNMPLYFKTDIGQAAADNEGLMSAMESGGLPLQTVVSNNLVKAGQMFRRERSYDGVNIASKTDSGNRQTHEALSDTTTIALRAIVDADHMFHGVFVKQMEKQLKEEGSTLSDNAGNQAKASVDHTEFSSVVHNFVRQMLLGLKAQTAADEAIAALKRGEKPIIAVESTMGSFLNEFAASNGISQGASLGSYDYRVMLTRALERTRVITMKDKQGNEVKKSIPLSELDPLTRAAYQQAQDVINELDLDIPASPIDWMRAKIAQAGYSVAEITGRKLTVDYSNPLNPTLSSLSIQEKKDKVQTTRLFNSGKLDALILNVAGSTGISLHASEKFTDQRQRHMIVAQAAQDINIFMQMLGRIHRTGQVKLPQYTLLSLDLPTEKRPASLLSKKMKSLNANTSSNTESATSVKTADMLNKYGDQIIGAYLNDNPELTRALGLDSGNIEKDGSGTIDIARKATGRLALQPISVQKVFYAEVEAQYNALLDYLNKTNQNELEPSTFDFDAKETKQEVLFEGADKSSPFGEDAIYGEYSVKAQGVPMKPEEINAEIQENLDGKTSEAHVVELGGALIKQFEGFYKTLPDGVQQDTANKVLAEGKRFLQDHRIGKTFRVDINGESFNAVVTNIRSTHKTTGNPLSLSKVQVSIAVNGALRHISVPATQFQKIEVSTIGAGYTVEQLFKEQPANQRETAKIVTGNLLAAYGEIDGARGTIISFTKADGTTEQGILLPKTFDFTKNTRGDYRLSTGEIALKFLQESNSRDIDKLGIMSRDSNIRVLPNGKGIAVQVPKSKLKGGKYFLDQGLIGVLGDFVTVGNHMKATTDKPAEAVAALELLMKKQALYALPSMADEAKSITGNSNTRYSKSTKGTALSKKAADAIQNNDVYAALDDIIKTSKTPNVVATAKAMKGYLDGVNVRFERGLETGVLGSIVRGDSIDVVLFEMSEEVLIHELAHAVTLATLDADISTLNDKQRRARTVIEEAYKRALKNDDIKNEYGAQDIQEFTAEFMSNPIFRAKLALLDKSIVRTIVNAVRNLFGLPSVVSTVASLDSVVGWLIAPASSLPMGAQAFKLSDDVSPQRATKKAHSTAAYVAQHLADKDIIAKNQHEDEGYKKPTLKTALDAIINKFVLRDGKASYHYDQLRTSVIDKMEQSIKATAKSKKISANEIKQRVSQYAIAKRAEFLINAQTNDKNKAVFNATQNNDNAVALHGALKVTLPELNKIYAEITRQIDRALNDGADTSVTLTKLKLDKIAEIVNGIEKTMVGSVSKGKITDSMRQVVKGYKARLDDISTSKTSINVLEGAKSFLNDMIEISIDGKKATDRQLKAAEKDWKEWEQAHALDYVIEKRADGEYKVVANGVELPNGMRQETVAEWIKDVESLPYFAEIDALHQKTLEAYRSITEYGVDSGVLDKNIVADMRAQDPYYVPFIGDANSTADDRMFVSANRKIIDKMEGATTFNHANDAFTNLVVQSAKMSKYIANQDLAESIHNAHSQGSLLYKRDNRTPQIKYVVGNKTYGYVGNTDEIKSMLSPNVDKASLAGIVARAITTAWGQTVTRAVPLFAPINAMKDTGTRMFNLRGRDDLVDKNGKKLSVTAVRTRFLAYMFKPSLIGQAIQETFYENASGEMLDLKSLGGLTTFTDALKTENDVEKLFDTVGIKGIPKKALQFLQKVINHWNNAFEHAVVVASYAALVDSGVTKEKAAFITKDMMNFSQKGTKTDIARIAYVFFNPAAQDALQITKTFYNRRTGVNYVAFAEFAVITGLAAFLYMALSGQDDEDEFGNKYMDLLTEGELSNNMPIPLGDGEYWKIPVPFGAIQSAWVSGVAIARSLKGVTSNGDAMASVAHSLIKSYQLTGEPQVKFTKDPFHWTMASVLPTLSKPIAYAWSGKRYDGTKLNMFLQTDKYNSEQGNFNTQDAYKRAAVNLRKSIGIDITPEQIQVVAEGYLTGPLSLFLDLVVGDKVSELQTKGRDTEGMLSAMQRAIGVNRVVGQKTEDRYMQVLFGDKYYTDYINLEKEYDKGKIQRKETVDEKTNRLLANGASPDDAALIKSGITYGREVDKLKREKGYSSLKERHALGEDVAAQLDGYYKAQIELQKKFIRSTQ